MSSEKLTKKELDERVKQRNTSFSIEILTILTHLLPLVRSKLKEEDYSNHLVADYAEKIISSFSLGSQLKIDLSCYTYYLEDAQMRYFLDIIIQNLPEIIRLASFKKYSTNFTDFTEERCVDIIIGQINDQALDEIQNRADTIINAKNTIASEFPIIEGKLIRDRYDYLIWKPKKSRISTK